MKEYMSLKLLVLHLKRKRKKKKKTAKNYIYQRDFAIRSL